MHTLSQSELQFIRDGANVNVRSDGRGRTSYRPIVIRSGPLTQCNGSARLVVLGNGNTDILVGIKVDLETPTEAHPNEGRIEVDVQCSSIASLNYRGEQGDVLSNQLTHQMQQLYGTNNMGTASSNGIDLSSLCVIPGEQCWILYIDVVVLAANGPVTDAVSMAIYAALKNTRIPKYTIIASETSDMVGQDTGGATVEISDDPAEGTLLNVTRVPISLTLSHVGTDFLVDVTEEEVQSSETQVTMGVNRNGEISGLSTLGQKGWTHVIQSLIEGIPAIIVPIFEALDAQIGCET